MAKKKKAKRRPAKKKRTKKKAATQKRIRQHKPEVVALSTLKPHPQNYQDHPDDQLEHLAASIRQNGIYKNVVIARDGTILAGHGVTEAARLLKLKQIPVIRLPLAPDDPRALKVVVADNELGNFSEVDDRKLSELLREIMTEVDDGLMGTGFDEGQLANLLMVTRPASEIETPDAAAEWLGMPGYVPEKQPLKLVMNFATEEDRAKFIAKNKLVTLNDRSAWWPEKPREDPGAVEFQA